jgi:hypothetical protein
VKAIIGDLRRSRHLSSRESRGQAHSSGAAALLNHLPELGRIGVGGREFVLVTANDCMEHYPRLAFLDQYHVPIRCFSEILVQMGTELFNAYACHSTSSVVALRGFSRIALLLSSLKGLNKDADIRYSIVVAKFGQARYNSFDTKGFPKPEE